MTAVLCGPRQPRRIGSCATCGRAAGFQCDEELAVTLIRHERHYAAGPPILCDAWACALHAVKVGPNRHRCQGCSDEAYLRSRRAS